LSVDVDDNTIEGNTISFNGGAGVVLSGVVGSEPQ